jgi:nitrogen fixation/metabolism regulation signal transduction histidine kinase
MAVVALGPLLGALLLGRQALREAFEVGINQRIGGQLDQQVDLYRRHFEVLRRSAERVADLAALDPELTAATAGPDLDRAAAAEAARRFLTAHPDVAQLVLLRLRPGGGEDRLLAVPRVPRSLDADPRVIDLDRPLRAAGFDAPPGSSPAEDVSDQGAGPVVVLRVRVAAPRALFDAFDEAGAIREVYQRLAAERDYVSASYLLVFSLLLGGVIAVALGFGVALARRVTRRVGQLVAATARVGRGDLRTSLPVDDQDEVGELTRAFNRMVRDLRESRDRIDYLQRISAWQEFARRLAHEIKNPLTPIQLAVQEMGRSYPGDDPDYAAKLADAQTIVQEEIATLRRLVGEFSAFAKLPEVRLELSDLGDAVEEIGRSLRTIPEEEAAEGDGPVGIELVVDVDGGRGVPVELDPMLFRRVLDNLVRNAVQAILGAGGVGRVTVTAAAGPGGRGAEVRVVDDGPGIPADLAERIFDPYVTTRVDGTGLGLAIVKKIVLEHDGQIVFLPRPGGGTEARIRLPGRDG